MEIGNSNQIKEIMDSLECFSNIEDELIKLFCLVNCAITGELHKDYLHKEYIKEKINRILEGKPLVIDNSAKAMYIGIKLGQFKQRATTPNEEGEEK